jgi:hypothetical protein
MSTPANYGNVITEVQMNQDEIDYVQNIIKNMPEDGLFVEWGSGGSTCAWLDVLGEKQKLISVEHNESWHSRVTRAVKNHFGDLGDKFRFFHIPEQYIEHGYGNPIEEHPMGTDKYLCPPPEDFFNADVFFIDGIARATCALVVLLKHTKKDPVIFIHDYVGREAWYEWATQFYNVEIVGDLEKKSTLARLYVKKD